MAKLILVVDDAPHLLKMVESRLKNSGYNVKTVLTAQEALTFLEANKVDLIILDLMLPGMTGEELCLKLKNDDRYKHIPIILFSGLRKPKDLEHIKELKADAFIMKPFVPQNLLDQINKLISKK